ncbi:immunoglobulin-like domain-containing protein [Listeria booriae]|uniref:immunoglobulin-like domain-containing protein n=1 Tax=Listeria booriae TaxID=1552123 RepID=UPI0016297391|nr:immunoglobulin-like domain-containing protein [Listeria booriae]MBC1357113.1 DUF5011 domain-containing protein [Listeria booriae]
MKKPKNKVFKKVAVGLLATNIIASGVVANVPFNVLAAESSPSIQGTVQGLNLLQNPTFTGDGSTIPKWGASGALDDRQSDHVSFADGVYKFYDANNQFLDIYATPTQNGLNITHTTNRDTPGWIKYIGYLGQTLSVTPGQTYTLSSDFSYVSGNPDLSLQMRIISLDSKGNEVAEESTGWLTSTSNGQNVSVTATPTTSLVRVEFKVLDETAEVSGKVGTVNISNAKFVNADQVAPVAPTINDVYTTNTTVTGKAEPNANVTITAGGETIGTAKADSAGNYAASISPQVAGKVLTATATDGAGNVSDPVTTTVKDSRMPSAPTINPVKSTDTIITGLGTPGDTITLKTGQGTYTGKVASDGTYAIAVPSLAGVAQVIATATNPNNGNVSPEQVVNVNIVSDEKPVITATNKALKVGDAFNPLTGVTATDAEDGALTSKIKITANNVDTNKAGTYAVTYSVTDSDANTTTKTITVTVTAVANTLTANNFAVGLDNYVKGTYTGNVAKLGLEVNGSLLQVINATGTPYQYYAKGKILSNTDQVYVISYDATNKQLQKVKVNITQQTAGTVSPAQFYIGKDNYVTGSLTGDVKKLSLTINGVEGQQINVAAPNFKYYANNLIRNTTDNVIVKGYDAAGKLLDSKTVIVSKDQGQAGTITSADTFKIGKDSYVTGAYTGDVSKVELQVNGATLQRINVTGGTIKYYAKNNITKATDVVKLVGYNSSGVVVSTKTVPVAATTGDITANPYVIGTDSYVKGQFSGDVAKISLTVNGVKQTTINAPAGPDYQYYAKSLIQNATDNVVITAYDSLGGVLKTVQVPVSKKAPTGTVTANTVIVGDSYLTGTATGEVKKVTISVNGVTQTSPAFVQADGTYKYYIKSLNLKPSDTVRVIGLDGLSNQLATGNVTITQ